MVSPFEHKQEQGQGQEQQQQQQQEPTTRIYLVTDGLRSHHTKLAYRSAFNHFIKTTIKNEVLRTLLDTKQQVIESKIIDHIEYLKDIRKLSYWSILVACSAIFHFFEMNDVHLNTRKIKRFLPTEDREHYAGDRPYSIDEIAKMLEKCDVRSRVVILLMASTGMRIGGLQELRYGDIKKINEFNLYLVWVYNTSKKDRYYTFTTPECGRAIDEYLQYRRLHGEKLKDSSPLIRDKFDIDNPFTAVSPRPISMRRLSFIIEKVLKQSGVNPLPPGQKRRSAMKSHGFRKFFTNQCDRAGVNFLVRETLLSHKLPGTNASYVRQTEEDRLKEYVKAIDLLTISLEGRLTQQIQIDKTSHEALSVELERQAKQLDDERGSRGSKEVCD